MYGYPGTYQGYYGAQSQQALFDPTNNCKSLYVGNLHDKIPESLLFEIFSQIGPVESCKLIKDKNTSESAGYGFVDFYDHYTAAMALQYLNGKVIYGMELKVNWAFAGGQKEDTTNHYHIFVGELGLEIDDKALYTAFAPFGSISDARIMMDPLLNRSRGFGFVAYRKKEDAERAIREMNGEWIGSRPVRCRWANQKGPTEEQHNSGLDYNIVVNQAPPTNTNVYVGNIPPETSDLMLRNLFNNYGAIEEIKIFGDKGFAHVKYKSHESAAKAIVGVTNRVISNRPIKCSWAKEGGTLGPFGLQPVSSKAEKKK